MKITTRCLPFFLLLMFCIPATADLVLGFSSDNGASFADSFDVQVGDSLTIGIYLQQEAPETVLTDDGLASFGFNLTRASGDLGTISNPSVDSGFGTRSRDVTTPTGFEWEYGASPGTTGLTGDTIRLGSFQFNSTAEGASTFTVEDRSVGSGIGNASWATPSLNILDEDIFGTGAAETFQFSINATTAVPEPSSFLMLACIACVAIGLRRRVAWSWQAVVPRR